MGSFRNKEEQQTGFEKLNRRVAFAVFLNTDIHHRRLNIQFLFFLGGFSHYKNRVFLQTRQLQQTVFLQAQLSVTDMAQPTSDIME